MKKQLFIDSDVILDLLAQREPFYDRAAELFTFAYNNKMKLYTTAVVLANVFYILQKTKGKDGAVQRAKQEPVKILV
jgi:predicted nucleic acid-binding protein